MITNKLKMIDRLTRGQGLTEIMTEDCYRQDLIWKREKWGMYKKDSMLANDKDQVRNIEEMLMQCKNPKIRQCANVKVWLHKHWPFLDVYNYTRSYDSRLHGLRKGQRKKGMRDRRYESERDSCAIVIIELYYGK